MASRLAAKRRRQCAQRLGVMQAQDLDIGGAAGRRVSIGGSTSDSAGRVAAGENVFGDPGVGRARPVEAADRVQQRHAVRLQAALHRLEEGLVIRHADMLEHADRDDAVELPLHRAIVASARICTRSCSPAAAARACAAASCSLRERDAGDAGAEFPRQRQRHAAPAAADVEHRQIRPVELQLGGDMALLGDLRLFQRLVAAREIGAGILPVAVQEQA